MEYWKKNGLPKQSSQDQTLQLSLHSHADLPYDLVRILPVFLWMVRHCASDGGGEGGTRADPQANWEYDHRFGGDHRDRPRHHWLALRPHRPAAGLHLAIDPWFHPGPVHRSCGQLRIISPVSPGHRRDRGFVCHYAIPHLGDVCSQCGWHRQRHHCRPRPPRWT